jgi:hypothetical protein
VIPVAIEDFANKLDGKPFKPQTNAQLLYVVHGASRVSNYLETVIEDRPPRKDAVEITVGRTGAGDFDDVITNSSLGKDAAEMSVSEDVVDIVDDRPVSKPVHKFDPHAPSSADKVRAALDVALKPVGDFVDGAVAAMVVATARKQHVDLSNPGKVAELFGAQDLARIRDDVVRALQRHGAAAFYTAALHLEDAWRSTVGPVQLDFNGAVTLMELSAGAQYDARQLSVSAFYRTVTARVSGAAGLGIKDVGRAWAGGSASGPGMDLVATAGSGGAGAQLGVTYGRAEAAAGLEILGRHAQIGVGVSAGFELGLQLSATVAVKLGPFAANVPNFPVAVASWAAGALADMAADPGKAIVQAIDDVADTISDIAEFFADVPQSAVETVADLLGLDPRPEPRVVTATDSQGDGRHIKHYETFEDDNTTWIFVGNAGIDRGMGFAAEGENNAWMRADRGIHVIAGFFDVLPQVPYRLSLEYQTSPNWVDFVMGVSEGQAFNARGDVIAENNRLTRSTTYRTRELKFITTRAKRVLVYLGLLADGADTWCRIDKVRLHTDATSY